MVHTFCTGYVHEPYKSLVGDYPGEDVYPPADFRTEWGPIFHRGRLDGTARIPCPRAGPRRARVDRPTDPGR